MKCRYGEEEEEEEERWLATVQLTNRNVQVQEWNCEGDKLEWTQSETSRKKVERDE